jgi:glycosyltransferase involved in cell wall biosynthesis
VVDNDAAGSARGTVEVARLSLPLETEYLVEPERNIALARNRGVARALELGADFIAFVDDDEVVRPDWLQRLLDAQVRCGADAVCGDVVPRFSPRAPGWAARAGLHAQSLPRSGTRLTVASTNNALVSARLLRGAGPPFDPAFGVTGSSDSLFFLRAVRRGARVVSAPEAVVEEHIPPSRSSVAWVTRRAFRVGNAALFCERALPRQERRLGERLAKAGVRMAASAVALPVAALFGRARLLRAFAGVCYGAGCLAAVAGYRYAEYRELDR